MVAAHDLPAGSVLRTADVRAVALPDHLRPAGSLSSADAVTGRLLSGAARSGEPITDVRLVGNSLPVSGEPGAVTVAVRIADSAVAELLQPGQRVDVIAGASTTNSASVLARGAVVVTVRRSGESGGRSWGPPQQGPLVLVAVPPQVATQVAASSLERPVAVTLR
ncbi:SAF domain-containing protein [Amycolatopsis benzoatilytica]|uniref:SAF domain-containing protein n=1 Tax=Amycolatopsis benzoatilytica TaxID=346045 RepID=UPI001FE03E98|nr:SAF domain-containing protein [Amycolatopsis benzoatilytica]